MPTDLATWTSITNDVVVTVAVLAGGFWAFYVFVIGRSFRPVMQIAFDPRLVVDTRHGRAIVVSVRIKNISRTNVRKGECIVAYKVGSGDELDYYALKELENLDIIDLDDPLAPEAAGLDAIANLFGRYDSLEPGEEASEEVVVYLAGAKTFKIVGRFITSLSRTRAAIAKVWRPAFITRIDGYHHGQIFDIKTLADNGIDVNGANQ